MAKQTMNDRLGEVLAIKADAKQAAINALKGKKDGKHIFSDDFQKEYYQIIGVGNVYFKVAYLNGKDIRFTCDLADDIGDVDLDTYDFEQDDTTFFNVLSDIVGEY